jgi:hypothetical protein
MMNKKRAEIEEAINAQTEAYWVLSDWLGRREITTANGMPNTIL